MTTKKARNGKDGAEWQRKREMAKKARDGKDGAEWQRRREMTTLEICEIVSTFIRTLRSAATR
ncbi:MAG: hypothetical protein OXI16_02735 [Chloroflexota bacterium]|nr:hypothetical protein [Chloroflexota bacterium]